MKNRLIISIVVLFCARGMAQTVYDIEAVRPFQGEPLIDESQAVSESTANEQDNNEHKTNKATQEMQANALPEVDNANDESNDNGPSFVGEPVVISADDRESALQTETVVTGRRIYQCRDGKANVFVDDENKAKFSDCSMVRDQQTVTVVKASPKTEAQVDYCTGIIQFRGNTYVFDDKNPCPFPADFFKMLTPIEAQPGYYLNEPPQP